MTPKDRPLRDRLLDLDPLGAEQRRELQSTLAELFERRLSPRQRLGLLLPTAAGLLGAIALTALAVSEPPTTPWTTRLTLLVLALIGLFWFLACGRLLRRGSLHLVRDRNLLTSAALGFTTLQSLGFGALAARDPERLAGLLVSLLFSLLAAVAFLHQRGRASELRLREELLRARLRPAG